MPRTYTKKDVHTSPKNAGAKNLETAELPKDEDGIMNKIYPLWVRSQDTKKTYNGLWTDEEFAKSVSDFFEYCDKINLKPCKSALQLWLGISRTQYYEWQTKPEKFGVKTNILAQAEALMELYLVNNIFKYPTGSIFLLKAGHGFVETSKLDISDSRAGLGSTKEEIADQISKLGLDQ